MKLLTKAIRNSLPRLNAQDGKGYDSKIHVKFFTPDANWTWYATEGEAINDDDGNEIDFQFFGLVDGMEKELGYFNLSELESIRGKFGLPVERDMYLGDKTLNDFKD